MAKITILTRVYNPGKYIYRCVDSVLNQTFEDFKFVIVDNASSDGTKEVLEEYARKDKRICLMRNELNNVFMLHCMQNFVDTEYFMVLDHDDWLEPNALEVLYQWAETQKLDIVFGRTDFWTQDEEHIETRGLKKNLVTSVENLPQFLPYVYWQFRTTWGSIIKSSLIANIDADAYYFRERSKYGGDTIMMLSMVFSAQRVGFTNEIIHNYRLHKQSSTFSFCRDHFLADWFLFDFAKNLVESRGGFTPQNESFLYVVYCNAIIDTLTVAIQSGQHYETVISVMLEILKDKHTQEMLPALVRGELHADIKRFKDLYGTNIYILLSEFPKTNGVQEIVVAWNKILYGHLNLADEDCEIVLKDENLAKSWCEGKGKEVYDCLFVESKYQGKEYAKVKLALLLDNEANFTMLTQRLLLLENQIAGFYDRIPVYVEYMIKNNELFQGISKEDLQGMPEVVLRVSANLHHEALEMCLNIIQSGEVKMEAVLQLALRLAAMLEYADVFVDLKKFECALLIECANKTVAEEVLRDLEDMCPGDENLAELRFQIERMK